MSLCLGRSRPVFFPGVVQPCLGHRHAHFEQPNTRYRALGSTLPGSLLRLGIYGDAIYRGFGMVRFLVGASGSSRLRSGDNSCHVGRSDDDARHADDQLLLRCQCNDSESSSYSDLRFFARNPGDGSWFQFEVLCIQRAGLIDWYDVAEIYQDGFDTCHAADMESSPTPRNVRNHLLLILWAFLALFMGVLG